MTLALALLLFGLAFCGAFISGLVGVGGAVVMIPLLYYVPPLLGAGQLPIQEVAGLSMTQVLAAALMGAWSHGRHALVHHRLATATRPASRSAAPPRSGSRARSGSWPASWARAARSCSSRCWSG